LTSTLAIMGKSGSGKTTVTKAFLKLFQEVYPEKTVLLFDNDLSGELGHSFGLDIRNTIYGIRSGKHEYKTGIPENMNKQEFIEWALEDIVEPLDENVDIVVSWLVGSKDCRCPITNQLNDAITKLIERYDIVIFDCEFDLKYLNQLVDIGVDTALIVANPTDESAHLARRIEEFSSKYSAGGQIGVVLNKVENKDIVSVYELLKKYDLDILGTIPYDEELEKNSIARESKVVQEAIKQFYFRLNLPQG
jgi:CO dehydrogenase maturation factor